MSESSWNLLLELTIWLASLAACILTLVLSRRDPPKWPALSVASAALTLLIGCIGLWTPFSLVPRLGYAWVQDDFRWYIDLNQLFVVPLALGLMAVPLALRPYFRSGSG